MGCAIAKLRNGQSAGRKNGAASEGCAEPHENPNLTLPYQTASPAKCSSMNAKKAQLSGSGYRSGLPEWVLCAPEFEGPKPRDTVPRRGYRAGAALFRVSGFGVLSVFGFRPSDFRPAEAIFAAIGPALEQHCTTRRVLFSDLE